MSCYYRLLNTFFAVQDIAWLRVDSKLYRIDTELDKRHCSMAKGGLQLEWVNDVDGI